MRTPWAVSGSPRIRLGYRTARAFDAALLTGHDAPAGLVTAKVSYPAAFTIYSPSLFAT